MNIFQKLFKVIQSFLHAFVNHIQDPILMAEQAIRDLKKVVFIPLIIQKNH